MFKKILTIHREKNKRKNEKKYSLEIVFLYFPHFPRKSKYLYIQNRYFNFIETFKMEENGENRGKKRKTTLIH
jgi:hypothetical protein